MSPWQVGPGIDWFVELDIQEFNFGDNQVRIVPAVQNSGGKIQGGTWKGQGSERLPSVSSLPGSAS